MGKESTKTAWISVFGVIAVALIGGAVTLWTTRPVPQKDNPPRREHRTDVIPIEPVMGQLEEGINRQGMDFSAYGLGMANAPLCAEECRKNPECKAMTYVISQKTCWLKRGVPAPFPPGGPAYISAVKVSVEE